MDIQRLISMANQIGDFYESYPDKSHAEQDIAGHLNKLWALPMRQQIAKHVQTQNGEGLHVQVKRAIQAHLQL